MRSHNFGYVPASMIFGGGSNLRPTHHPNLIIIIHTGYNPEFYSQLTRAYPSNSLKHSAADRDKTQLYLLTRLRSHQLQLVKYVL